MGGTVRCPGPEEEAGRRKGGGGRAGVRPGLLVGRLGCSAVLFRQAEDHLGGGWLWLAPRDTRVFSSPHPTATVIAPPPMSK